jgi:L-rhamnose isomerase
MTFRISDEFVAESNQKSAGFLAQDYEALSRQLARRKVDI